MREFLTLVRKDEGHRAVTAPDGIVALKLVAQGTVRPDLILADYNLPNGMDGLQVIARLREKLHRQIPVIILTGDISTDTLRDIARQDCVQLNKPVKLHDLTNIIQRLLPVSHPAAHPHAPDPAEAASSPEPPVIFVIEDDSHVRDAIRALLEEGGQTVEDYPTCETFLKAYRPGRGACLLIDAYLPGMNGFELVQRLHDAGDRLPAIMVTGDAAVPMAVQAMKAGAMDFIEKPDRPPRTARQRLRALEQARDSSKLFEWRESAVNQIAGLTSRQRQIIDWFSLVTPARMSRRISASADALLRAIAPRL